MKELPDEQKLLEILELIKEYEQAARELCDMSMMLALKY